MRFLTTFNSRGKGVVRIRMSRLEKFEMAAGSLLGTEELNTSYGYFCLNELNSNNINLIIYITVRLFENILKVIVTLVNIHHPDVNLPSCSICA